MPIYTLDVCLISGPITEKFLKKNSLISRTIQIRGDQPLEALHDIIFEAFDREDDHLYEFQMVGSILAMTGGIKSTWSPLMRNHRENTQEW